MRQGKRCHDANLRSDIVLVVRSVFVAAALFSMIGCAKEDTARLSQSSIRLLDLSGKPFDLWEQARSATVVLFARSDCPISNRFAPEIRRLYETYHSKGVEFFIVYVDPHEKPESIRRHLQEFQYPCQGLRDPTHTLVSLCGATVTPEAVVFSQNREMIYRGRINDQYVDFGKARTEPTTHDLGDAIESALSGQSVANPRTKAIGCLIKDLKG
jgi:AhpC/TSA family